MNNNLQTNIARLESQIDVLETELSQLQEMLVRCGFPEGIKTLKSTIQELMLGEHAKDDLRLI